ncbi:THO complex subunit 4-A [Favolaschia claudopus]|uniref:THO complex subunit 4-A n=1 Tax=Favolaschia claudopus TaxID=2862362 RepID=A0AAW0D254_9AGAR
MASFRANRGTRKPYTRPAPRNTDGQWLHDMADDEGTPFNGNLASHPRGPSAPSSRLVVSNLHYEITPKDLTAIFGQIGTLVSEPQIRYDRSGRSSGTATVSFETLAEATRAKNQYDGILAKGQPMTIVFDLTQPRQPRVRSSSAPTTSSLLNRIQKPPLLDRLSGSKDDSAVTRGPRGAGPVRTLRGSQKPARGGKPGAPKRQPKAPKTAQDLDKELDDFMGDNSTPEVQNTVPTEDVEMA